MSSGLLKVHNYVLVDFVSLLGGEVEEIAAQVLPKVPLLVDLLLMLGELRALRRKHVNAGVGTRHIKDVPE